MLQQQYEAASRRIQLDQQSTILSSPAPLQGLARAIKALPYRHMLALAAAVASDTATETGIIHMAGRLLAAADNLEK